MLTIEKQGAILRFVAEEIPAVTTKTLKNKKKVVDKESNA